MIDLGPYFGDRPAESQSEREERYLEDRTCLACGDVSGFPHDCEEVDA